MQTPECLAIVGVDVRRLVRPKDTIVNAAYRDDFRRRCRVLEAVAGGTPVTRAAELYRVDVRTARDDATLAMTVHRDGELVGFRACLPYRRKVQTRPKHFARLDRTGSHSMTRLIMSDPRITEIAEGYRGPLPNGRKKNRQFDRMFGEFKKVVRAVHGDDACVFRHADSGRRALYSYIRRQRRAAGDAAMADESKAPPTITRLSQAVPDLPLDRIEFDAHKVDVDWTLQIPDPKGGMVDKRIEKLTVLAAICAASRYLLGYVLVLGEYNRLDVLRLVHRMLRPWQPRELIVPGLKYAPGARLGLVPDVDGALPRGLTLAGDNAMQHHAELAVENILGHHRGIYHRGPSYVPEVRAMVETFFGLLEKGALRQLPGGFQPTRGDNNKVRTSYTRSEDHPLHWHGMCDLMDVIGANYNVTPHNGHGMYTRKPVDVLDEHVATNWVWRSGDPAEDARAITTAVIHPTIRGASGRCPYVEYQGATYRSRKLTNSRHLCGQKLRAEINYEDMRSMTLFDESGSPWSRLEAQPPWNRTPHDIHMRQQINRLRSRGIFSIVGVDDAVVAYRDFARSALLSGEGSVAHYARADLQVSAQQLVDQGSARLAPPTTAAAPSASPSISLQVPEATPAAAVPPSAAAASCVDSGPCQVQSDETESPKPAIGRYAFIPRHGKTSFANLKR